MNAVTYSRYGPPSVLALSEVEKPNPKEGELLIRVGAAEVTKADCEMRSFKFAVKWFWLPLRVALGMRKPRRPILGSYFAGEVVSLGPGLSLFTVGDKVYGCGKLRLGAHAEYVCLPESYTIALKPENLSFAEASSVPLGGLNALHFLTRAKLKAGESLLINGAGGSIGLFAIQIAKATGASVTAVDKASKEAVVREAGADFFVDYAKEAYWEGGARFDVVFDMVPGSSYSRCLASLKPRGRYVMGNPRLTAMLRSVFTPMVSRKRANFAFAGERVEELLELKTMIEQGAIRPIVDKVYPLARAAEVHRLVESEERNGAVVLTADA